MYSPTSERLITSGFSRASTSPPDHGDVR
jgi:hypothetical protein